MERRRRSFAPVLAILIGMILLGACAPREAASPPPEAGAEGGQPVVEGGPAPDFRLASLAGDEISPQDYAGEVVLVDFWATWCGPCHAQAKILALLHEEFADRGVHFLAVSMGEDEETVRTFAEQNPFPYPVLIDPEDRLSPELGIWVLPTLMIVARDGSVSYLEPGVSDAETVRRALYEAGADHSNPSATTS